MSNCYNLVLYESSQFSEIVVTLCNIREQQRIISNRNASERLTRKLRYGVGTYPETIIKLLRICLI